MSNNLSNNINNIFSQFSQSSLNSGWKFSNPFSEEKKTTSNTIISNKNTPIKSFSYQEDKNLKYRQSMEDTGIMIPDLTSNYKVNLFCILDGHGGSEVVNFVKERLPDLIKNNISNLTPITETINNSFNKIDEELKFYDSDYTGSTATLVIISDNKIYCGNVGDSKSYLIDNEKVIQISTDHKCTNEEEGIRIKNSGGQIIKNRVMGQLILTRTLGDLYVKQFGVINTPDINVYDINETINYIIIASDGVWDVVDLDTITNMGKAGKNVGEFCKDIVKLAINKGTKDNVSCIVVSFKG
jgi:serine/threonine protein phosphatase PrpC